MENNWFVSIMVCLLFGMTGVSFSSGASSLDTDSLAYELQREKVNRMLENRKLKFGEYDQSIQSKTGIFGIFKTKGDMQRSIDILKQIVLTDNEIFIETRKLLDLKDYEKEHYQKLAVEYDTQRAAYMKTISKLQHENEKLRQEVTRLESQDHSNDVTNYYALLIIIVLTGVLVWQYVRGRLKKLTKL